MKTELQPEINKIRNAFDITEYQVETLSNSIYNDISEKKMLKMLPTHIYCNNIINPGEYLAIDFGGSNIRVAIYRFTKNRQVELLKNDKFSLRGKDFDYTTEEYELQDIMDMIAEHIKKIIQIEKIYLIGYTFSFAMNSISSSKAVTLELSKGFKLKNAIGKDLGEMLKLSLNKNDIKADTVAILNDTTATLLTGNFENNNTDIACIVGTGHNIAFVDRTGEIVNTESGCFQKDIPLNGYDIAFLDNLPSRHENLMEKLVGGRYIGGLAEELKRDLVEKKLIDEMNISTKIFGDAADDVFLENYNDEQKIALKEIAQIVFKRTAKLIVAELVGIIRYLDPDLTQKHNIVFDGSVYEKTPYFRRCITEYIHTIYKGKSSQITHTLVKDGSIKGAAISAATIRLM